MTTLISFFHRADQMQQPYRRAVMPEQLTAPLMRGFFFAWRAEGRRPKAATYER